MSKKLTSNKKAKKAESKPKSSPFMAPIAELIATLEKHGLSEIEIDTKGSRFRVARQLGGMPAAYVSGGPVPAAAAPTVGAKKEPEAPSESMERLKKITSPFVGTFYRSPSPEADNYVQEGTRVKKGDTLCIVEAMKLMNEIESEISGKIVSILVENGQPVEFGEPLF
ncbi:MAG: acetyl-CoA carboxylase biotin carboxyl carrier protein, partial [Proteobacteria bacterium]